MTMSSATKNPWLPFGAPRGDARFVLYCFHHAGGGASTYRLWQNSLPSVHVAPVQLPGREGRLTERPFDDRRTLTQALLEQLGLQQLDRPFAFFGHSLGARVAFELTRALRRQGRRLPTHLLVSSAAAPQLRRDGEIAHDLPHERFVERLKRYNGMPREILESKELMDLLLPVLRADFKLLETAGYDEEPPLPCPITVFGGKDDETVELDELEGWRQQTTGPFARHILPGNHFYLTQHREALLGVVARALVPA